MKGGGQGAAFGVVGFILLAVVTNFAISFKSQGPERGNLVQVPVVLAVLGTPALAYVLRRRRWLLSSLVVAQLGLYLLYETGVSIHSDMRVDLLLIYPAILYTAWMALRPEVEEEGGRR